MATKSTNIRVPYILNFDRYDIQNAKIVPYNKPLMMPSEIKTTLCADNTLHVQAVDSINYANSLSVVIFMGEKHV